MTNTKISDLSELPEGSVVTFQDIITDEWKFQPISEFKELQEARTCPFCVMELSDEEYKARHVSHEVGGGVRMKSVCESEQACIPTYSFSDDERVLSSEDTIELIAGGGLKGDGSLQLCEAVPSASVQFVPNNNFEIYNEDGEMLVRLDMKSGDVEYGDNYCLNDAARIFWDVIGTYKQPDIWEEKANLDAQHILREVRHILGVGEGEDILVHAKKLVGLVHAKKLVGGPTAIAAPGCLDDMPEEYYDYSFQSTQLEIASLNQDSKMSWRAKTQEEIAFDDAIKVVE